MLKTNILLFAILLSAFVLSANAGAITSVSATSNDLGAKATPTSIAISFTTDADVADGETITITASGTASSGGNIFTSSTNSDIGTGCTITNTGTNKVKEKCVTTANTVVITADGLGISAGNIVVTITSNIATNNAAQNTVKFVVDSNNGGLTASTGSGFAITNGAIKWGSAKINNNYAGQTATEMVLSFTSMDDLADDDIFTIVATGTGTSTGSNIFATSGGSALNPACTVTSTGTNGDVEKCVTTATTIVVTADSGGISAGDIVVTITTNIAQNFDGENDVTFVVTPTISTTALSVNSNTAGIGFTTGFKTPAIYIFQSECRVGGIATGALVNCDQANCETCTRATNGFVKTFGLQLSNDAICTTGTNKPQDRCDSTYSSDTYVDIVVSTNGLFGTLTCAAFMVGATVPTNYGINFMNLVNSDKKSANYQLVDENMRNTDVVITLVGLTSRTQYDIYCHMENVELSPKVTVWTAENNRVWGNSLVPGATSAGLSPDSITLTFYHGLELASGGVISLKVWSGNIGGTSATVFNNANVACTATSTGDNGGDGVLTLSSTASEIAHVDSSKTLTITTGEISSKGSKIVVTCNSQLKVNPTLPATTPADIISYELTVSGHPVTLKRQYGWIVT